MFFKDQSKTFMATLLKMLSINLYTITNIENYNGPLLPEGMNILEYQKV